ncbi:hypothetical protein F5X96DRAFT_638338 [Biscogniauxia mediterranea]|nr:hypothetical protein F5X96DRAFT_638338 [Biscogniauxia mediterranea]
MRWRNIMRLKEMSWLRGHRFQGQVIFPVAGYISMLYEAAVIIAKKLPTLVELQDLVIRRAITFDEGDPGIETNLVIRIVSQSQDSILTECTCYSSNIDASSQQSEQINFTGRAIVRFNTPLNAPLPSRSGHKLPLIKVDINRFYESMSECGLRYSGNFRVHSVQRRSGLSTVTTARDTVSSLRIDPPTLDAALHGLFAAFHFPGDGTMWTSYLPTSIRRIRINSTCPQSRVHGGTGLIADCYLRHSSSKSVKGDIDIFCANDYHPEIQIQGLACSAITAPSPMNDVQLFARTIWKRDPSSGIEPNRLSKSAAVDSEVYTILERSAYFFFRELRRQISREEISSMEWNFQYLMDWVLAHLLPTIESGNHTRIRKEWRFDTRDMITAWRSRYSDRVDLQTIHAIGNALPSIVRGSVPALQVLRKDDMISKCYQYGLGAPQANKHLEALVSNLAHKYPRMNILEVGAGTGGATRAVLKALGNNFHSYAFTDISSGFFEDAQSVFAEYNTKITYQVLDIECDPEDQGFKANSFDLVIASNVLHATRVLSRTLENCRSLIRPGGYMILVEICGESLWPQFVVSGLPGWWLGREDGRTYQPTVSESRWERLLQQHGFSGLDQFYKDAEDDLQHTYTVMVSQAVDNHIEFLRQPLAASNDKVHIDNMVLIGGRGTWTSITILEIQRLLRPVTDKLTILYDLEEFDKSRVKPGMAVICIADIEEPVFRRMSEGRFKALKLLFTNAKYVMWVTRDYRHSDPYASMVVGLGRSVLMEHPYLRAKFIDIDSVHSDLPAPVLLSESFLRMIYLDLVEDEKLLWSNETEETIINGRLYIPRVCPDDSLNQRYNAGRREILKSLSPASVPIALVNETGTLKLQEFTRVDRGVENEDYLQIRTLVSSICPIYTSDRRIAFPCIGSVVGSGLMVFTISSVNCSLVKSRYDEIFSYEVPGPASAVLNRILTVLLCESLLVGLTGTLWMHDADSYTATVFSEISSRNGINVFFSASARPSEKATIIHEHITERDLEHLVPRNVQRFADMGTGQTTSIGDILKSRYEHEVDIQHVIYDIDHRQAVVLNLEISEIRRIIARELSQLALDSTVHVAPDESVLEVDMIPHTSQRPSNLKILDWRSTEPLPVRISTLGANSCFSEKKTYLFIGLSGDVGLSLCAWMIDHGAKYFAFGSRNPAINSEEMSYLESKGGNIRTFILDVADKQALEKVYDELVSTMPPVAGVVNGAMVLRDTPLETLSLDDFESVLRPKVDGSRNLDDLFHCTSLDFFVLLSSTTRVLGNPAQSNYAAANMYMSTLAAQRRKRGLAASTLDIPMLLGVGYLTRSLSTQGSPIESQLRKLQYIAISESDFHIMFGEAITSGLPDSKLDPTLTVGIGQHSTALWNRFPRLWHYASSENPAAETRNQSERSKSLKVSLSGVLDHKEAFSSLEASLTQKLSFLLQMPCDQIDKRVPLTAFGIDSLVAVEIRSWILSELEVDVPVFEILNKASVMDICQAIVEKLPPLIHADEECVGRETRQESLVSPLQQPAPGASIGVMSPREHTTSSTSASTSPKAPGTSENDAEPISSRPITAGTAHSDEAEYERIGEMSHSQAQIYFLHQLLDDKSTHNVVLIGKFRGHLDLHQLRRALYYVCKHHEGLRSAFYIDKSCEKAVQSVKPEPVVTLKHMLIADAGQVRAEIDALGNRTFDIEKGHTMDVIVLSQTPLTHHIAFVHHHIVLDGISWGLFLHDLSRAFAEQNLQSPITQAIDVCNRRRLAYKPMYLEKELRFWSKLYENPPGILPLFPFAKVKTRQILKAYETETFDIKLNSELTNIVKQRAAEIQVTPCHIYLSTLAILLARCIGVYDFSIGMIDANRLEVNENEVIGNFLNILPLRFRLKRTDPFYKVALTTSKMVLAALENSRVPFDLILDQLKSSRSGSHHPLFQVALNYRLGVANQTPLGNGEIEWTKAIPPSNPYDLMVDITETRKYTVLSFTTHKYLYRPSDTKLLMKWYCRALEGLCRNTSIRVWDAPMANEADMKQMSILMQGEQMEITWEGTLVDRVDEIASQFPDSVAIKDGSGTILTYDQLRKRVGQIAECLQANAIPPDSRVAILLTPTADAICCLLAVMRSGLVWVPLDTRNPPSRLLAIITDCQPYTLISNAETRGLASELAKEVTYTLNLDDIILPDMPEVENSSERSNPAVILYTSGSTGVPKGVLLTHQSILNQIFANTILYGIKREVVLQQTSFGFDLALDQIFHALANGGTLIVVGHEGRGDPMHIARIIRSENITYTLLVPSEYLSLLHYGFNELKGCTSWSFAFAGGEKISFQLRRRFQKLGLPNLQLINIYGPTEASISCARGIVPYRSDEEISLENDSVWPMPNYTLAILDNRSKLAPIGFPGEICIAGVGLALGYVNRPEETRHKFTHPTVVLPEGCKHAKSIFYRTGDFGRLLEDGSLNILGRIAGDDQIKLRGFRIELGDVANVIMKAANNIITNAVISYRKETETLVAFVVFNNGFTGEKSIFSESLKAALPLPSYMCPAFIVPIEQIPTNHHGKVDRTAVDKLPIPSRNVSISTDDLSALELRMRNAWEEVLPRDTSPPSSIHLESDFFHVGGNSMLLIKLRSVLQTTFGVSLTLLELSQSSTLRSMTARVDKNPNAASPVWHINWETEVDALYDGLPSPRVTPSHNAQSDLVIILTGATGFVGRHILQHLVDDERVAQVHCIAIRPDNLGRPRHVPIQSSKIFEYPGNLSDSHLGLSDPAFQALTETADLIIHNGADVSFMKSYGTLRSTNVMSTRTLLELAVPRCIPFHFISTASVANFTGSSTLAEVSISNRTPPSNTIHGYAASKWVSESLLERVASEHGLRVWIHRPTNIVGHGAPESDIVAALLKYSQILRAVPEIKTQTIEGSLDLVSVEDVSMAIAQAALDSLIAKKRVALTFMHHCNGAKVASNELRGYIESMEECHCRVLNPSEWLELAREQGLDELIFLSLSSLFREGNKVMLPMLTKI